MLVRASLCNWIQYVFHTRSVLENANSTLLCLIPKVNSPKIFPNIGPSTFVIPDTRSSLRSLLIVYIPSCNNEFLPFKVVFYREDDVLTIMWCLYKKLFILFKTCLGRVGVLQLRLIWRKPIYFYIFPLQVWSSSQLYLLSIYGCDCNGEPSNSFHSSKAIHQGNPLSLYIFILRMEFLSLLIEKKVSKDNWKAIWIGRAGTKISHSLFADDIFLFGEDDPTLFLQYKKPFSVSVQCPISYST